ncbi:hypothetical protein G6F29_006789 [Rhizopus arrhizus]|nr:hypothetical protein G6F29_006789 [Rhizopus arrhizus]
MYFSKTKGKKQEGVAIQQFKQQSRGNGNNLKKWPANNAATRNSNQNAYSATNTTIVEDQESAKVMHDRMLFLLGNMIGTMVDATVKDGCKFRGVFHGASTEGDLAIVLSLAQKIYDPTAPIAEDKTNPNPVVSKLLIYSKDLVEVTISSINFTESASDRNSFKTDTDITGKLEVKERELHKWAPSEEDNALGLLDGDLESSSPGETAWDQFAVNEKLFGLKTDFNEEIYTTRLDRSAPGFKDREKRAIKVANEIQKVSTTNVHMLEERGFLVEDSGMDEEDLYGAVVRDSNKYVPPALRKQSQKQTQEQQPNAQQSQVKKEHKSNISVNKVGTANLTKTNGSSPSPIANLPTSRQKANEKGQEKGQEKAKDNESPKRIESEVANTFRHFAMMEKNKLNAKKQALQKKEKDGRLAELMAFHQTFKLNVPVPADLLPLLSTGKKSATASSASSTVSISSLDEKTNKQESPSTSPNAATSAPTSTTAASTQKSTASPAKPSSPLPAASPASSPPAVTNAANVPSSKNTTTTNSISGSTFKLNAKASSFKPNPSAAAFVPNNNLTSATHQDDPNSFFSGRNLKKGSANEQTTMKEAFKSSSLKEKTNSNSVGPTWPFGSKSYRIQFNQFNAYDEDMYTGYPSPGYGYGYPQYHYPQYVPGMPQMAVQQGGVAYMSPQFVSNVPISAPIPPNGAPPSVGYSPQMTNISPHGSPFPQGFPSPQRSPMVPQGMPPQVYQYQATPMVMRYPPEMMMSNAGGPQVMMQRPIMAEPTQYSSQQPEVAGKHI